MHRLANHGAVHPVVFGHHHIVNGLLLYFICFQEFWVLISGRPGFARYHFGWIEFFGAQSPSNRIEIIYFFPMR